MCDVVVRWRAEDRAADRSATDPRTLEVVVVQVEVLRVVRWGVVTGRL